MTTKNPNNTTPTKKAVIFFDCIYDDINPITSWKVEKFCMQNDFELINVIYKYGGDLDFLHFESLLLKLRQVMKTTRNPLIVIIGEYTYNKQENMISCAILGALKSLKLIELYVYKEKAECNSIVINQYEVIGHNLIEKAIEHFKLLQKSNNKIEVK